LVVEDDRATLELVADTLARQGFEVLMARNGREAVERLSDPAPALIVLDLAPPADDRVRFAEDLERCGLRSAIPLLAMGNRRDEFGAPAQVAAEGFLAKPFDATDLGREVARLTARLSRGAEDPESREDLR
jgi:DNA-binding response OmpR family regulator